MTTFYGLGISPQLIETLDRIKFTTPTPIQRKAIPHAVQGSDIIGIAQTGTGKTLAFVIPMIQRLSQKKGKGLVLVPTRELAAQCDETCRMMTQNTGMQSVVVIGGASMRPQIEALKRNPRIIIATPGRLIDLMEQRRALLHDVHTLVLDEADRMLDMGFAPQIERIIQTLPKERQTMLFSATIPPQIVKIAARHMKLPVEVEVAPSGTTAEGVVHELFIVKKESKIILLEKLLQQYRGPVLVFCRTKHGASRLTRAIRQMGHYAAELHADISYAQRCRALDGFKSGKYRILAATDIASRGIDVMGIELVVNYDLPEDAENYVHRVGRTARAGDVGRAVSFATPDQRRDVEKIERLIQTKVPVSEHPEVPSETFTAPVSGPGIKSGARHFSPRRRRSSSRW